MTHESAFSFLLSLYSPTLSQVVFSESKQRKSLPVYVGIEILIFPLGFYLKSHLSLSAVGRPLETAFAIGFAALETIGYALITLLRSHGNLFVFIS
ncbi:MAG: hypothetical protein V7K48_01075 [Nostoc sp.]|uniref:hypothetical protein n=1 Tax=Nostoc sp. TaxID=1180 RepID=UPI002FF8B3FB